LGAAKNEKRSRSTKEQNKENLICTEAHSCYSDGKTGAKANPSGKQALAQKNKRKKWKPGDALAMSGNRDRSLKSRAGNRNAELEQNSVPGAQVKN
jgi:hypothetical protein